MELLLIHITDIHIQDEADFEVLVERIPSLAGVICNHVTEPEHAVVILCVTGDFAYSGLEEQYDAAGMMLKEVISLVEKRFPKVMTYLVFVPGNHDCDFDDEKNGIRNAILESPKLDISDGEQLKTCTIIQKNYFKFVNECEAMSCDPDKILTENILQLENEGITLKFHCINTSWCSKKKEDKGKIKIVNEKMNMPSNFAQEKEPKDIVITMMHHDAEWLDWEDKTVWDDYHKEFSDIILVGHDHRTEYVLKQNYDESSNYFCKGNQLYDKENRDQSGFNILKLVFATPDIIQEGFFTYEWKDDRYRREIETGFRAFKKNRFVGSGVKLRKELLEYLEDMDIDISCGKRKELKLSDVFGFPTLKVEKGNVTYFIRNMEEMLEYISEMKFLAIEGGREYGKTSLLKRLFIEFYSQKKYPAFLDASKINSADGEVLNGIVENAYSDIYVGLDAGKIMQEGPCGMICLVDNIERINLSDKSSKKVIQYLTNKFEYVIITRGGVSDIYNPVRYIEMNEFIRDNFGDISIQPTRRTSRERIVNRWLQLSGEEEINSVAFEARRKEKYAQIHAVMKSNYFNKTPLDLLLVLSYLDEEETGQLDYSRYSYVYDKLILNKLTAIAGNDSGRASNNISVYKTILQKLAYKMYIDDRRDFVEDSYVLSVITDYKEHHSNTRLNAIGVLSNLVTHKFLECKGDMYKFRHSYMYYYFVGSYIESALSPDERTKVVRNVFENIADDVNYNVALFLAYRMNIEYEIIPLMNEFGGKLLAQFSEFKYEHIKKLLEEWSGQVDKKIEKIYNVPQNEQIPELREKAMREMEEKETSDTDAKTDVEMRETNRNVLSLARYVDFMGSILKNYSGKMENEPREKAIDFIFTSVFKVIGSLCGFSTYIVDKVIQVTEEKIKEGEEDIEAKSQFSEVIKSTFARIIFRFIGENLTCLAGSMDSEILCENINSYCARNNSEFVKMARVEYLIRISTTGLPVNDIGNLFTGKSALSDISQRIMKDNIYKYLSSYQFETSDRQAVCDILKFNSKALLIQEERNVALDK